MSITTIDMKKIVDELYNVDPSLTVREIDEMLLVINGEFQDVSFPFTLDMVDAYRSLKLFEYCKEKVQA